MRLAWAIVAGLVLGGGLGWYLLERERTPRPEASTPPVPASGPAEAGPGPVLYRWRDADGVLQVSDTPPANGPYEEVKIRSDQNVVPMSGPAPAPVTPDD